MKRFTITVPLVGNDGNPRTDFQEQLEKLLRQARIEGWTSVPGTGVWHQYQEPVAVYIIDSADDIAGDLLRVAGEFGTYADQEAVYVTAETIETFLVRSESRDGEQDDVFGESPAGGWEPVPATAEQGSIFVDGDQGWAIDAQSDNESTEP